MFDQRHLKSHRISRPSAVDVYAFHSQFCEKFRRPLELYTIIGSQVSSTSEREQLALLRYHHVLLEEYYKTATALLVEYALQKEGLPDPRRTTLSIAMLVEITRDVCFYEAVNEQAIVLAGAVETLIDLLRIGLVDATNYHDFQCLAIGLQSTCADLKRTTATLLTRPEDHLRLFELARGMHEAQSIRLLSILASIFLPLTLASGLLSSQTRFADLYPLLYDFFGVIILLGTIVGMMVVALRFHAWWKGLLAQLDRNRTFKTLLRPNAHIMTVSFLVLVWGFLLASFLDGMIKDVGLGLKILGYGLLAAAGIILLALLALSSIMFLLRWASHWTMNWD